LKRDHADFRRAAADIDDHRPDRGGDRHVGADRGRHRLLDQIDSAGAGVRCGIADRAAFDRSRSRRHADHDFREAPGAHLAAVHLVNEVLDHLLGDIDVGDDSVAQRPDRLDLVRRLAHHQLGVLADGFHLLDAVDGLDRDDRGLVEHDSAATDVDERVGGPEIDRHVVRHPLKPTIPEHSYPVPRSCSPSGGSESRSLIPAYFQTIECALNFKEKSVLRRRLWNG
jgi:hypothetical protein